MHVHSEYSLLDGACKISNLIEHVVAVGMHAVAITDHGNLFAAADFYREATTRGVKPVIGCEVYVAADSHKNRGSDSAQPNHLVLLCESQEGYCNLLQLVSTSFLDGFYRKPRVDHELLARHCGGLIALSACIRGEVAAALAAERYDQARARAQRLRDIFGKDNFFLEVQDQGIEGQLRVNRELVRLAKETGIPLVATNDCHYLTKDDVRAHEVLLCIQTGKTMSDPQRMKFASGQFYFKTVQEMVQLFAELPEALERTTVIADRCNAKIEPIASPFPEYHVPEGHTLESYFEKTVREGFDARVPQIEQLAQRPVNRHLISDYEARLTDEIRMIQQKNFAGYFLIVWDFIRYARAQASGP